MKVGRSRRIAEQKCPLCGFAVSAASSIGNDAAPKPGDATICINCGSLAMFTKRGLRKATPAELKRFANDPRVWAVTYGLAVVKGQKRQ